jgi:hypothetical protein
MNRWTLMAFATLFVGLGAAWLKLRGSEPRETGPTQPVPAVRELAPAVASLTSTIATARPPPATPADESPGQATTAADGGTGAYDDAHLYRHEGAPERFPPTAQGVLLAFERVRPAAFRCLEAARTTNPALTNLLTVEVRIAAQDDGAAAIEELRLPSSNDPALAFRGCLVQALLDQRFTVPEGGFTRIALPLDLSQRTP